MIVGRRVEFDRLVQDLTQRRAVVVTGPAGIGKSTLAEAAAAGVGKHVVTRGIATLSSVPFLLFRSHLGDGAADSPEAAAEALLRSQPDAVVLDDLQWADPGSVEVIEYLMGRVALVATVRDGDPDGPALVARLERIGFGRLALQGLDEVHAEGLVRTRFPDRSDQQVDELVRAAHGNPLLLTQMGVGANASPSLTTALLDRLAELDDDAREAMYELSVLGRPASAHELGPGAEALVRAGLADHVAGAIVVHHPLLAELVVEDLAERADDVRRRLSDRVSPYEAALLLARTGDREGARAAALRALEAAPTRRERAEALLLAIRHAPEGEFDVDHRVEAAELLEEFGRPAEALACCGLDVLTDSAVSDHDRGRLTGLAAYAHWLLGQPEAFATLIEQAIGLLRGSRTEAEVRVLGGSTMYATWVDLDGRSALERAHEAVALADEIGEAQSFARTRLASVLSTSGQDGWVDVYLEAMDLAERDANIRLAHEAAASLVLAQWTRGDAHAGRKVAARQLERLSSPEHRQYWLAHAAPTALLDLLLGVDPAEIVARWQPVTLDPQPFRNRPYLEAAVAIALADAGLDHQATEAATGIVERAGTAGQWQSVAHWALVELAWAAGRDDEVGEAADRLAALGMGDYPPAVMARLVASHAAVVRGRPPRGPEPTVLLPAWRATPVEWRALEAEHHGDHAGALTLFEEAAEHYVDHDERSRGRCLWAAARVDLARGGDPTRRLLTAEEFAERHGYEALLRRIHPLIRRAGIARSAPTGRAPAGLTSREYEVLGRVARGRTSAQIAGELGITRDTVDDLVQSALRRLGVSNRRAAVARLRAEGALGAGSPTLTSGDQPHTVHPDG